MNNITLSLADSLVTATQIGVRTDSGNIMQGSWTKTATVTNVTQIELTMTSARLFGVGTKISIWKRGK